MIIMKFRKLLCLCLLGLGLFSCGKKADAPFFFIQLTDTQMGFKESGTIEKSVGFLTESVDAINRLHPAFVVVTGDMLNHWNSEKELTAYKGLIGQIDKDIPVYEIPGNHDFRPGKEPESAPAYFEHFGGTDRFSFVYNKSLFLGINSCYIKDEDVEKEAEQYSWLVNEIAGNKEAVNHIFLFTHCSIIKESPDEEADYFSFQEPYRSKYLKLCKDYGIDAVFSGHFHRKRFVEYDGTQFVTCTASGTPLEEGFTGINVVAVRPDSFSWEMVPQAEATAPAL